MQLPPRVLQTMGPNRPIPVHLELTPVHLKQMRRTPAVQRFLQPNSNNFRVCSKPCCLNNYKVQTLESNQWLRPLLDQVPQHHREPNPTLQYKQTLRLACPTVTWFPGEHQLVQLFLVHLVCMETQIDLEILFRPSNLCQKQRIMIHLKPGDAKP